MQKMQEQSSAQEKYPKENPPSAASFLRSSILPGVDGRDVPIPPATRRIPAAPFMPYGYFGLFQPKSPVLGAAEGVAYQLSSNFE